MLAILESNSLATGFFPIAQHSQSAEFSGGLGLVAEKMQKAVDGSEPPTYMPLHRQGTAVSLPSQ
ncbi:hypothetical protein, partial [Novosphingobium sediminis]|uniref:hypothetical protein n=1 Tax=Novosphingobium sediminis TaxID=707214 RepID=UPI001C3FE12E